jgi:HK97 family phage portal protein
MWRASVAKLWQLLAGELRSARGRKSFSEPPFWLTDDRLPMLSVNPLHPDRETIEHNFEGYVSSAYKENGVIYACIQARQLVFSEARFQWREFRNGRPGDLFGSPDLELLEKPWPGGTTGELLTKMDAHASLAGQAYVTTADDAGNLGKRATGPGRRLTFLPPDRVEIVIISKSGNPYAADAKVGGYLYTSRSPLGMDPQKVLLLPNEVCHYSPIPDPEARFRGMSWLTPIIREIAADKSAMKHKLKFFENGATLQAIVSLKETVTEDQFKEFIREMKSAHEGVENAYKTMFVGGGADVTLAGADLKQLDFSQTQGHGETRIAAAAGVPPVIVGLSEGLQAATYSNYAQARRRFADGTIRPLWRIAAASLQVLLTPPANAPGASLWYDDRDIAFLREDRKDASEIQGQEASTIRTLVDAGFEPETIKAAVMAQDWSRLVHTGLFSVQLQPPGSGRPTNEPPAGGGN